MAADAQTDLQLSWELENDVFASATDRGTSHAVFTLVNRDRTPLPPAGWALYFNALLPPTPKGERGPFVIDHVVGELYRLRPTPGFAGVAPGQHARFEYTTALIGNISQAPVGPYIVFDASPAKGHAFASYVVKPFTRPDQQGRAPRVVSPAAQFERNAAARDVPLTDLLPVFPTPLSLQKTGGDLRLHGQPTIVAPPELKTEAALTAEWLEPYVGRSMDASVTLTLALGKVAGRPEPEAYTLTVEPGRISILGNSGAGVFYGLQSLRSLLPPDAASQPGIVVPHVTVTDAPRFGYRGLHVDAARNFQPKATVLRVIDLMARYKLNVLHFHLTDDEGWRIEIPSLPELTDVGARRGHTLDSADFLPPSYGSGPDVGKPYGSGYFSSRDYIEIVRYAAARHVEVMPEIEIPGHARAAIYAMEARYRRLLAAGRAAEAAQYRLKEPEDQSVYTSAQLYHDNVMNPALESTYAFIARVVDDLVAIHHEAGVPLRNLHMGGDEVPGGAWEKSPAALAYVKDKGLSSIDDLWFVFYRRVELMLQKHNIPLSGWEEMGVRKTTLDGRPTLIPNPGFAARGWRTYVWNNVPGWGAEDLAYRLANGGYRVVLTPVSNLYLDMAVNPNPEEPGLFWGGFADLNKPFDFIPFDYYRNQKEDSRGNPLAPDVFLGKGRLTAYGRDNIVGIQACLWSETAREDGRYESQLMPRLLGFVERAWAPEPDWSRETDAAKAAPLYAEAWSRFVNTVGKRELPKLDRERLEVNYRIPTPGLKVVDGQVRANLQLPGFTVRYTTDGSEPTAASAVLSNPVAARAVVRVAAFDRRGRKSATATVDNR